MNLNKILLILLEFQLKYQIKKKKKNLRPNDFKHFRKYKQNVLMIKLEVPSSRSVKILKPEDRVRARVKIYQPECKNNLLINLSYRYIFIL